MTELSNQAIISLADARVDPVRGVHECRKAFKKTRTLMRLLNNALGESRFNENQLIKRAAARLSPTRDAQVRVARWQQLDQQHPEILQPWHDPMLRLLNEELSRTTSNPAQLKRSLSITTHELALFKTRIDGAAKTTLGVDTTLPLRLKKFYRRAAKHYWQARKTHREEDYHEARKRLKDLLYSGRFFKPEWSAKYRKLDKKLKRLTEILGDNNDLYLLQHALQSLQSSDATPAKRVLETVIHHEQNRLLLRADKIASTLLAESADDFLNKLWPQHSS